MWLIKYKHGTPTQKLHGVDFTNGYAFVEKYYDYRFLKDLEKDFEDVTPENFLHKENELKRVLIKVPGGIGDSLFAIPLIEGIKKKYGESCVVDVYGLKVGLETILHHPDIRRFHCEPKPFVEKYHDDYDDIFDLSCSIENNPDADFENAYKVVSDLYNISPDSYNPTVYVTPDEVTKAKHLMADLDVPLNAIKIGVHLESTSSLRAFPKVKVKEFLDRLCEIGHVFVYSNSSLHINRQNFTCPTCNVEDSIAMNDHVNMLTISCVKCNGDILICKEEENPKVHHVVGNSIRTAISMINEMDLMICIDSGLLHIAAGLEKPMVALFSNIDGALRTSFFKNCVTINTPYRCAPCQLNNVPACPPMIRENVKEPPCIQKFNLDEILGQVNFIIDQKGRNFESVSINPPAQVRLERNKCLLCGSQDMDIICRKAEVAHARCLHCESIFAMSPFDTTEYSKEAYHDVFFGERLQKENYKFALKLGQKLIDMLGTSSGLKVMEIGCSNGQTLKGFNDAGWGVYGMEISQSAIDSLPDNWTWKKNILVGDVNETLKNVQQIWKWPGPNPYKLVEATEDTPEKTLIRARSFNCVYIQHTFEHFDNPMELFGKLQNLMHDDGYMVILGPSASAMDQMGTGKNGHLNTLIPGEHQFIPSKKAMLSMASNFGLEILEYYDNKVTSDMYCLMTRKKGFQTTCR